MAKSTSVGKTETSPSFRHLHLDTQKLKPTPASTQRSIQNKGRECNHENYQYSCLEFASLLALGAEDEIVKQDLPSSWLLWEAVHIIPFFPCESS